jgi:hypothetical protein
MSETEWSETSAHKIQMPVHHHKERIKQKNILFNGLWSRIIWLRTSVSEGLPVYIFMVHASVSRKMEKANRWYISNYASLKSHIVTGLLDRNQWKHTFCMCFRITATSFTPASSSLRVTVCTASFPNRSLSFYQTAFVCSVIL